MSESQLGPAAPELGDGGVRSRARVRLRAGQVGGILADTALAADQR